jgi:virginiamycin B lyase
MNARIRRGFPLLAFAAAAALCVPGCSGSSSTGPAGGGTGGGGVVTEPITFVVQIPPRTSSSSRAPKYVSPSTRWITATVTPAGASGPGTTSGAACQATQCSITIQAPVGSDTFVISLYDAQNGHLLSTGQTTQTVVPGQVNTVTVVFGGVPASLQISPSTVRFTAGVPSGTTLAVNELDADGNTIIAPPAAYPAPITITSSDTTGTVTISPVTITGPGQTVTVSYNGSKTGPASVTLTASTSGVPAATATIALLGRPYLYEAQEQNFALVAQPIAPGGVLGQPSPFGPSKFYDALAVGPDGTLYASAHGSTGGDEIDVYPGPSANPVRVFNIVSAASLAVDGASNVYAGTPLGVYVYPGSSSGSPAPVRNVLTFEADVALGHTGALYLVRVANDGSTKIDVDPPNADGAALPVRAIVPQSGATFVRIAVDTNDNVYVKGSLGGAPAIFVYAAGSGGPAAARIITGPATDLSATDNGIAVDSSGYIFTVAADESIEVFPPSANGNVAPQRVRTASPASRARRPSTPTTPKTDLAADIVSPTPAPPAGNPTPFATLSAFAAGSSFFGIASGSDGRVWATEATQDAIVAVTSSISPGGPGTVTTYPVPHPAGAGAATPLGITAGPDGALWFVEENGDAVGRITTAGVTTLYPLTSPPRAPMRIITGPDGNLWFDEGGNATVPPAIARITTSGTITEFPLASGAVVRSLAPGPDGNVYAVVRLNGSSSLVRVTPAGVTTTVATGIGYGDLALGADGNFYDVDPNNNVVQRISPAGTVTPVSVFAPTMQGAAPGPHGRVYIGGGAVQGALSVVNADGTNVVNFPIPNAGATTGIVQGPDNNLWLSSLHGIQEVVFH